MPMSILNGHFVLHRWTSNKCFDKVYREEYKRVSRVCVGSPLDQHRFHLGPGIREMESERE